MKLARFRHEGTERIGAVVDGEIVDLSVAMPSASQDMGALLAGGQELLDQINAAVRRAPERIPLDADGVLAAPVARPPKFLALGLNYADHAAEVGRDLPQFPTVFNKQSTCVNGPHDSIHHPRASEALDYEGEFGFVIGQRCRHVPRERAQEVIGGYLVVNDVSVRDWQAKAPTLTLGKSWDTHGPIGPWIVTSDEVPDPHKLDISTWVNGELRQQSNTRELIFDCFSLVETLSTVCTLEPGDIVATGTPSGVGLALDPPRYLVSGDTVRIEISGVGVIENTVVDEPDGWDCPA